jgi:hypothetical protein
VAKFIKFKGDPAGGKVVFYVNVDQVVSAEYDQDERSLKVCISGHPEEMRLYGEEAVTAVKLLDQFV